MTLIAVFTIALIYFIYSAQSQRFENTIVTAPMLFLVVGLLLSKYGLNLIPIHTHVDVIHTIAEITLILVLFIDASHIRLDALLKNKSLPVRMLLIGLMLTVALGTLIAYYLFPSIGIWQALLLAAILAPTDAALGQSVVSNLKVPLRIRQTLNVESGLNDGMALPLVLIAAFLASMAASSDQNWVKFVALQLILGPVIGIIVGVVGAKVLNVAVERKWVTEIGIGITSLMIAICAYTGAELVHGNGFIAAFISGLCFGNSFKQESKFFYEFAETQSHLLTTFTFLMFGAVLLPSVMPLINMNHFIYALLSLTVIRMLPVSISLIGSGVKPITHLFLGWFGPRGLASVLFALLILQNSSVPNKEEILIVTFLTVALSVILHGVTAAPFANSYAEKIASHKAAEEAERTVPLPYEKFKQDAK